MAKLTKEEIQALLKVAGYHWYYFTKKVTSSASRSYNDEVYTGETTTHLVQVWNNSSGSVFQGRAWSRDEDTAWRNAYKKLMKEIANG